MALFQSFFFSTRRPSDKEPAGATMPARLNLEERMAFRRDMLFESVGNTMEAKGIPGDAFRIRASRTDKRGHVFMVMIDLSEAFLRQAVRHAAALGEIGRDIASDARETGVLMVVGVYWRVCGQLDHTETPQPVEWAGESDQMVRAARIDRGCQLDARSYASDMAPLGKH